MVTNINYLSEEFTNDGDKLVTYITEAEMNLEFLPVFKALSALDSFKKMLKNKNCFINDSGNIQFVVKATARRNDTDEWNLTIGKHIAQDRAQLKAVKKIKSIVNYIWSYYENALEYACLDICDKCNSTIDNMSAHIEDLVHNPR